MTADPEVLMSRPATDGVDPLIRELYRLIRIGELSPGEHIEQRTMADRLNVSRTPLREALRALALDGVLVHNRNQGYQVAKLSNSDLVELYSLRAFLEGQLIRSMAWPDDTQVAELRELNAASVVAADSGDVEALQDANRAFYFMIFSWSPLKVLLREAQRIYRFSEPYRGMLLIDSHTRSQMGALHDEIIEALVAHDRAAVLELIGRRRNFTLENLRNSLGANLSQAHLDLSQSISAEVRS